jgi:hypothetical protein
MPFNNREVFHAHEDIHPGFDSSRLKTPIFHSTTPVFMRVSSRISGNAFGIVCAAA